MATCTSEAIDGAASTPSSAAPSVVPPASPPCFPPFPPPLPPDLTLNLTYPPAPALRQWQILVPCNHTQPAPPGPDPLLLGFIDLYDPLTVFAELTGVTAVAAGALWLFSKASAFVDSLGKPKEAKQTAKKK